MRRTVAVINQKGGVGKTTVTLGLASAAAAAGRSVLVVDLDPQGASSWVLGIDTPGDTPAGPADGDDVAEPRPTLVDVLDERAHPADAIRASSWSPLVDVLPSGGGLQRFEDGGPQRLATALARLDTARAPAGETECGRDRRDRGAPYEVVLFDCPPSLGSLTVNGLAAARHALIVVEPSALGLRGIGGVADVVDEIWDAHNPDLELSGIVLNRVPAISAEAERRIDELAQIAGRSAIWDPPVPQRVVFTQAVAERRPIHSYGARAAAPIATFDRLWARLRRTVAR